LDTKLYEDTLKKYRGDSLNMSAFWDSKAKNFNKAQKKNSMNTSLKVMQRLLEKGLLKEQNVLDIGGGTGRNAIPFAEHAEKVVVADISEQMLGIARNNAEAAGRVNLEYIKLNWDDADLEDLGWERHFDLVFASMCQGVWSREGIEKMIAASKAWCQINQFVEMNDSVSKLLMDELAIRKPVDVHNNREISWAIFNILWLLGFEPEISYLKDSERQILSIDDMLNRYSPRFAEIAARNGVNLKDILAGYASNGNITVERRMTLSMILWRV